MNREIREVRPVPKSLERILESAILRFGSEELPAGGRLVWEDPETYARQPVSIEWARPEDFGLWREKLRRGAADLGIALDSLALIVSVSSRYLGFTDLVFERSVADLDPIVGLSPSDAVGLRSPSRGAQVNVWLAVSRKIRTSRRYRKGTWLARANFTITTDIGPGLFRITPLDDETRPRLNLGKEVLRYVRFDEVHEIWDSYDRERPPEVYLDADILAAITRNPKSPVSVLLQIELTCVVMRAVLARAVAHRSSLEDHTWSDLKDSLVGRVIALTVGKDRPRHEYEDRLGKIRSGDLEDLAAHCEDAIELRSTLKPLLEA